MKRNFSELECLIKFRLDNDPKLVSKYNIIYGIPELQTGTINTQQRTGKRIVSRGNFCATV